MTPQASILIGSDGMGTPEELAKKRAMIQSLMMPYGKASNIGEGIAQLFNGISTGAQLRALNKAEKAGQQSGSQARSRIMQSLLGGGTSAPLGPGPFPPRPVANQASYEPSGDGLKDGIAATAQSLGISPVDLATAISYETGGTFNPAQKGPTTQWGQHKGLIQFGEPQAKKYGVDWNDPLGSQLGPKGAIAKYLLDTGVKPGMGIMDIYSAINAGGVGRYNRSDANNGGAPGTVADKVNQQMAGHRAKAEAMFGSQQVASLDPSIGMPAPQRAPQMPAPVQTAQAAPQQQILDAGTPQERMGTPNGGMDINALVQQAQNPWLSEQDRSLVNGLIQQEIQKRDPAYQMQQEKMRLEIDQMRNPQPKWDVVNGKDGSILRVNPATGENEVLYGPQPDPVKPTADIQEYEYAVQQAKARGVTADQIPSFDQWTIQQKKAGASQVNIDQKAEGAFDKKLAEGQAESINTMATEGMNAKADLAVLAELGTLIQGKGGALDGMSGYLAKYGIGGEGVSDIQAAQALINKLVPTQRQPGSGSMSDRDVELFTRSLPSLWNTPGGNQKILSVMQGLAEYKQAQGQIAQQVLTGEIDRKAASKMLRELPNPLEGIGKAAPAAPTAPATGMPDLSKMSDAELEALINGQ